MTPARPVWLRPWRRLACGEAGPGPAWALLAVTVLSVFVAAAGPRELASAQVRALRSALAGLPVLDQGVAAMAQWQAAGGSQGELTLAQGRQLAAQLAAALPRAASSLPAARWSTVSSQAQIVLNPAPQAGLVNPPTLQLVYWTALRANSRLIAGSYPDAAVQAPPRPGAHGQVPVTFQVAVTAATASRFGLRIGSVADLAAAAPGDPPLRLRVTAILRALRLSSAFWQTNPQLAAPLHPKPGPQEIWAAGALVGPAALGALQGAFAGAPLQGEWYLPLEFGSLTPERLPGLLAGLNSVAESNIGAGTAAARLLRSPLSISSGVGTALSGFLDQQQAAAGLDSLLIADVFATDLILILVCAQQVAQAHRAELVLARARGASRTQVAARILARTGCVSGPGAAAGIAAALAVLPRPARGAAPWALVAVTAATALAGPAVIAAWTHRRAPASASRRADVTTLRPSRRRLVAELALIAVACAALVALRVRGVSSGTGLYATVAPVLVAAAAAIVAARLYPLPLAAVLRVAAARPGAVAFLGLARAARSRLGAILPALTLVLTLTLAAFAIMVTGSVATAQAAAAWRQVGADAMIKASGNGTVSLAAQRAIRAVPGVRRSTAVYISPARGALAAAFLAPGRRAAGVGLVLAGPAQYASLAQQTPWPRFPAGLLARRGGTTAVPVLASAGLAAAPAALAAAPASGGVRTTWPRSGTVVVNGTRLAVSVAGTLGGTPAMPAGGPYLVLPAWAAARLPSIPGPDTLLATGSAIDLPALRAAAARFVPGAVLTVRAQVLAALAGAPAQAVAERLYRLGIWTAVLLSLLALAFGLAASARSRSQLAQRLAALGTAPRQARVLALTELVPLLSVAVLGSLAAGSVLAVVLGPVLNLAVFTDSASRVPVRPDLPMLLPAAGIVAAAIVIVAFQAAAARRPDIASALRQEEDG